MRISDWSSDVCSSDLRRERDRRIQTAEGREPALELGYVSMGRRSVVLHRVVEARERISVVGLTTRPGGPRDGIDHDRGLDQTGGSERHEAQKDRKSVG